MSKEISPGCQWLINRRIACPEAGYPVSEAKWATVEEWVDHMRELNDV